MFVGILDEQYMEYEVQFSSLDELIDDKYDEYAARSDPWVLGKAKLDFINPRKPLRPCFYFGNQRSDAERVHPTHKNDYPLGFPPDEELDPDIIEFGMHPASWGGYSHPDDVPQ